MKQRPNYKQLWRTRQIKPSQEQSLSMTLTYVFNVFLTTVISVVTLAVAVASYRVAEKQTEISDTLAQLELAKNQPKFLVAASGEISAFRQSGRLLEPQIPTTITIAPEVGVRDIVSMNGQASIFFTMAGTERPCIVAIRGLFAQRVRDQVHIVEASAKDLQQLIDGAASLGLRVDGFYTDVLISFMNIYGDLELANLGEDGSDLGKFSFRDSDIRIYAGAWSGGEGFYFDDSASEDACPAMGAKVRELVRRTNGHAGDGGIERLPSTLRRELSSP